MEKETKEYITLLKRFLGKKVNSILEIQCGDAYEIENCKALQDKNLKYIGVDIIDEIIKDNREYFKKEKNKLFITLDATNESIPQSDLVICSGIMEYLPIENIWSLIENIRNSGAKYVAFDYYHSPINNLPINENIEIDLNKKIKKPLKRAINLTQSPFYFPLPQFLIPTNNINHSISLYNIKDIEFYMIQDDENILFLKNKLVPYLEDDFNEFRNIFKKEKNGEKLLKNVLLADKLDWNIMYYNKPYKTIINKNNIYTKWLDFLVILFHNKNINRLYLEQPERYKNLITEENFLLISNITKDFVKWKYNKLF